MLFFVVICCVAASFAAVVDFLKHGRHGSTHVVRSGGDGVSVGDGTESLPGVRAKSQKRRATRKKSRTNAKNPVRKSVFINQIVDHPALNETTRGIIDALADGGFVKNETADIRVESAQANSALASQISNKFVTQRCDVVVCVGTISAQSMVKYTAAGKAKMVFSSVTDPVGAGLVESLTRTDKNITGVSNFVKLEPQLDMMKKIQPNLRKLGIVYNAGEANSISIIKKLGAIAEQFNVIVVKQAVTKTSDITQALAKIVPNVDAVFISNDNTALSCLSSIIAVCNGANIPVYVSDTDAVYLGALAALGPNQYSIGRQTGVIVAKILNGESVANLPVEFPGETELFINLDAAKSLNISIPRDIISMATKTIESVRE
jgi:putative ABC transport system substrate-binding protein